MFDPQVFKQYFPVFQQPRNHRLVYLDNAATTQRPQALFNATNDFYLNASGNAHRGSHRLARAATDILETCRQQVAEFIGAVADECIFTQGATAAMNTVANAACKNLVAGDEIVLSLVEHHANLVPWMMQAKDKGLILKFLPVKNGRIAIDELPAFLNERTRVVSLTAASNVLGSICDLARLKNIMTGTGILWGLDCAQYAAHAKIDVLELGCDFLVFSAHKLYGPTGVGVLWGHRNMLNSWSPFLGGGEMISQVTTAGAIFRETPGRFEAGTDNLAGIAGFSGVLRFLAEQDTHAMHAYEAELAHYAIKQFDQFEQMILVSCREDNIGVMAYATLPTSTVGVSDIVNWLDESDIAVRAGQMCAQPLADAIGYSSLVRFSLAPYNTREDIDRTVEALQSLFNDDHSTSSHQNILADLLEEANWQSRYRKIMALGDTVKPNISLRQEAFIVSGCEAKVWLRHSHTGGNGTIKGGAIYFEIDSEARLMRGLGAILLSMVNGLTPADFDRHLIEQNLAKLGLQKHLAHSRVNGFNAILLRVFEAFDAR